MILERIGEISALNEQGGTLNEVLGAFTALSNELASLPATEQAWLGRPEMSTILKAVFDSLAGRGPEFTATPQPRAEIDVPRSHPRAFSTRMRNITSTAAGRALIRLAPHLAGQDIERLDLSGREFKAKGLTFRKQVAFFASLLSTPEGRAITRLAASLAQEEWTERFWENEEVIVDTDHLIVGNGPVGIAFAHSLIESGNFNGLIISKNDAGGPFGWGQFQVNHRSRPIGAGMAGGPATSWALDDMGPVLVSPSDVSTSWGYATSDIMAAVTALNALAAGPMVTGTVEEYMYESNNETGDEDLVMRVANETRGQSKQVRFAQATFATGLGRPYDLPGSGYAIPVSELLSGSTTAPIGERVAVVGDGDSAMIAIARLLGLDGYGSTPRQVQGLEKIVWIRKKGEIHKETFPITERLRYADIAPFLPRLLDGAYPHVIEVVAGQVIDSYQSNSNEYLSCRSDGKPLKVEVDTVINATGFDGYINDDYYAGDYGEIVEIDGIPVARRLNDSAPQRAGIFAIGAAAKLPVYAKEMERFPVLRNENLPANTVALFRTIPAASAFGRMSAGNRQESSSKKRTFPEKKASVEDIEGRAIFERILEADEEAGEMSSLSQVLMRMRYLAAVQAENIKCDTPITLMIELTGVDQVSMRSIGEIPSQVIARVLDPLFDDTKIRHGLINLCKTSVALEETAAELLKADVASRPLTISIPVDAERIVSTGLTVAA